MKTDTFSPFAGPSLDSPADDAVLTLQMETTVLACFLNQPMLFAEHVNGVPVVLSGLHRRVANVGMRLLTEFGCIPIAGAFQEVLERCKSSKEVEELKNLEMEVARVDMEKEREFVLARLPCWIQSRREDSTLQRYMRARGDHEAKPSAETNAAFALAKRDVLGLILNEPVGVVAQTAASLLEEPLENPVEVIHGVLDRGSVGLFGSSSKAFKTWNMLNLAVAVATGKRWLGLDCTQGSVLYVNLELSQKAVQDRIQIIKQHLNAKWDSEAFCILDFKGREISTEELLRQLIMECHKRPYSLIIIDPLYPLLGGRVENSNEEMAELMLSIIRVAKRTDAAFLITHHYSKGNQSSKEPIDRFSGGGALGRAADTLIAVDPLKVEGAYAIDITTRNHGKPQVFGCRWDFPIMKRDETLDATDLKQARRPGAKKIYSTNDLLEEYEEGMSPKELRERVMRKTGASKRTIDRMWAQVKHQLATKKPSGTPN